MKKAALVSLLLAVIFFFPLFTGHYIKSGDLYDEYLPVKQAVRDAFYGRGSLAHSTSIGLGFPIYRDIQSGLYYPLNIIFLLPLNIYLIMQIAILLNILLLSLGSYILMRKFADERRALIFSAVAAFNGYILGHATHYSFLCSMALFPFHLYFLTGFMKNGGKRDYLLSVFTLLLILSGGHPQVFLYAVLTDVMLILLCESGWRRKFDGFASLFFTAMLSAPITLPLLKLAEGSYRVSSSQQAVSMSAKKALLLFFPSVVSGLSGFAEENIFYPSVIILFAAVSSALKMAAGGRIRNARFAAVPLLFLLLSMTGFTLFGSFTSVIRSFGFFVMSASFLLLAASDGLFEDRKGAVVSAVLILASSLVFILRGNGFASSFKTFGFASLISLAVAAGEKRLKRAFFPLLFLVVAADLFASNFFVNAYAEPGKIEQADIPEIIGKRVVTLLPSGYEFHEDYIKERMKTDDLRDLERFSTLGDRGVYYGAYSFNIYNTLTYAKYIEFFGDEKILQGGFSNIRYILNPIYVDYEYILVPDIPFTAEVKGKLMIPFEDSLKCSFTILYTGELEFESGTPDSTAEEGGLRLMKTQSEGPLLIEGEGFIYLMRETANDEIVHFPYIFERCGFEKRNGNPFMLFRRRGYEESAENLVASPIDGSFIEEKRLKYIPMDLIVGIFIALSGIMLLLSFVRKEIR